MVGRFAAHFRYLVNIRYLANLPYIGSLFLTVGDGNNYLIAKFSQQNTNRRVFEIIDPGRYRDWTMLLRQKTSKCYYYVCLDTTN